MSMLTSTALTDYRNYTKRILSYARYKIGSTYYKTDIDSIEITSEGTVKIGIKIEAATSNSGTVTLVQLYDTSGNLWFQKSVSLNMTSVAEAFYYVVKIQITEKEE